MDDLISRQAAIDAVGKYLKRDGDKIAIADIVNAVVALTQLPTAQPEIIRCKDCIKADLCAWRREGAKFCSFAERREEP